MNDNLEEAPVVQHIDNLIPKTLDDVIRLNRELVELGLATDVEIQGLNAEIQHGMPVKDIIDDWRLISLRAKRSGHTQLLLLGRSQKENSAWLTSAIVRIDLDQECVVTKSGSLYGLGYRGDGEPPRMQLIHICATLHTWGSGDFLGVPKFFY